MNATHLPLGITTLQFPPYLMDCFRKRLPFTVSISTSKKTEYCKDPGFMIELMIYVLTAINTELGVDQVTFHLADGYGAKSNGKWDGMVGELLRNNSLMSIPTLTASMARSEVVDFIRPPMVYRPQCFLLHPTLEASEIDIIQCFDPTAILVMVLLYVGLGLAVLLNVKLKGSSTFRTVRELYFISFQQDIHGKNTNASMALLVVIWSIFVTQMLFVAVAATLFYQTQKPLSLPKDYSDIPFFLQRYRLIMHESNILKSQLMDTGDPVFHEIRRSLTPTNILFVKNLADIYDIIKNNKNTMTYTHCGTVQQVVKYNHNLAYSQIRTGVDVTTIAVSRGLVGSFGGANVTDALARVGAHLHSYGEVERLHRKYSTELLDHSHKDIQFTVGTYLRSIELYGVLVAMCCAFLLVELITWKTIECTHTRRWTPHENLTT